MMKKNSYKKGFTLFETLASVIVFGIIMILMFDMSSQFFKLFTTSSSTQSMNSKFIKAYTYLQKELMITDAKYIYNFNTSEKNMKSRWFLFPIPTDKNSTIKGEGSFFDWQRIYIYYLTCTNSSCLECPGKSNTTKDPYRFCSDKQLIKVVYDYVGSNDKYFFSSSMSKFAENISDFIIPYNSNLFTNEVKYDIKGYESDNIAKFVEKRIISTDIFDLDIQKNSKSITIIISTVRKEEIKKEVSYGTTDFSKEPNTRFVDKMEFTILPKN